MTINGVKQTAEDIMRMTLIEPTDTPEMKAKIEEAIQRSNRVEIITETVEQTSSRLTEKREQFTATELQREHEYRRAEAEGLGRNPERAQKEADEWLEKAKA